MEVVVSFTPRTLYPRGKTPVSIGCPTAGVNVVVKRKNRTTAPAELWRLMISNKLRATMEHSSSGDNSHAAR
jgi:hypothetical protein